MTLSRKFSLDRRSLIKASGAAVAGAALTGQSIVAGQTPEATPGTYPTVIESSIEGVPNAYTAYPEPFKSVDETPGDGSTVRMTTLSYTHLLWRNPRTPIGKSSNPDWASPMRPIWFRQMSTRSDSPPLLPVAISRICSSCYPILPGRLFTTAFLRVRSWI